MTSVFKINKQFFLQHFFLQQKSNTIIPKQTIFTDLQTAATFVPARESFRLGMD